MKRGLLALCARVLPAYSRENTWAAGAGGILVLVTTLIVSTCKATKDQTRVKRTRWFGSRLHHTAGTTCYVECDRGAMSEAKWWPCIGIGADHR